MCEQARVAGEVHERTHSRTHIGACVHRRQARQAPKPRKISARDSILAVLSSPGPQSLRPSAQGSRVGSRKSSAAASPMHGSQTPRRSARGSRAVSPLRVVVADGDSQQAAPASLDSPTSGSLHHAFKELLLSVPLNPVVEPAVPLSPVQARVNSRRESVHQGNPRRTSAVSKQKGWRLLASKTLENKASASLLASSARDSIFELAGPTALGAVPAIPLTPFSVSETLPAE